VQVPDVRRDPRFVTSASSTPLDAISYAGVPLLYKTGLVGVLAVYSPDRSYDEGVLQLLDSFAGQARILIPTDAGGEGIDLQSAHVLVNYDLAWSPAAIEQRIGRIDRIGQSREVRIYAFRPEGSLAARVLDLMETSVGVFREPVGGLDAVLESVESELTALGGRAADDEALWERLLSDLGTRVALARQEVARAYDPLLDRRSCDLGYWLSCGARRRLPTRSTRNCWMLGSLAS